MMDQSTVQTLDLNRYTGLWYEIARYNHRFERNLVGCSAEYTLQNNGNIRVVNRGFEHTLSGKPHKSVGKARRPNELIQGELEVAFFLNFYAPYYVFELADDYRYALVGSRSRRYLWILSRTPQMLPDDLKFLINRIQERGYSIDNLIWVEQPK